MKIFRLVVYIIVALVGVMLHIIGSTENSAIMTLTGGVAELFSGSFLVMLLISKKDFDSLDLKNYILSVGLLIMGILALVNTYNLVMK